MSGLQKSIRWLIAIAGILLIPACSDPGASASPSPDPNDLYTAAAKTVQAQLSSTAAALPSNTPTFEPTETSLSPTKTLPGTQLDGTSIPGSQITLSPSASQQAQPPAATSEGQVMGDSAIYQYQSPSDGVNFFPGEEFHIAWGLKNNGSTTWNTSYQLRFMSGEQLSGIDHVDVSKNVAPGEKFEFFLAAFAPRGLGEYISIWGLYNGAGVFLYDVYLKFNVIAE